MSQPLVSIVVTVHTRLDFLASALESALAQTFQDFEIIVVDDSGSASARAVVARFADPRIRYCPNDQTRGVAASVQGALQRATGTYAAILNDDDAWEKEFLSRLVPMLEADERRVLAFADHWIVSSDGSLDLAATERNTIRYGRAHLPQGEVADPGRFVLEANGVPLAMGALFRRSALDVRCLPSEVAGAYDLWISAQLAASGGAFYYVPERLTRYRVHSRMETARRSPHKGDCSVFLFRSLIEQGTFPNLRDLLESLLARSTVGAGRDRLYFDRADEARQLFADALRLRPGWRPLAGYVLTLLPSPLRRAMGVSRA
jgi:glycosyltransferase involved in cell wall biosynthesis